MDDVVTMVDDWAPPQIGCRMNVWPPRSRASEYRERASLTRAKAETMDDPDSQRMMLESAAAWDRMADWEEKNHPTSD